MSSVNGSAWDFKAIAGDDVDDGGIQESRLAVVVQRFTAHMFSSAFMHCALTAARIQFLPPQHIR